MSPAPDLVPWTVNDVPSMSAPLDARVDGSITDHPDRPPAPLAHRS
ncbi:hypothetical protein ACVGVM_21400 [Pseudonocardia bannensis]|nr:hypothetical protein [Pseudonocardia bannensis]